MVGYTGAFLRCWAVYCCFCVTLVRHTRGVAAQNDDDASADYPDCGGDSSVVGDGLCDLAVNSADCGFDGGDCCKCTCVDGDDHVCGEGGTGFFCQDPDAPVNCGPTEVPTAAPTASPSGRDYPDCEGYLPHIEDGFCDEINNNAGCGYDGGDCCACTCGDDLEHPCGQMESGYDCRDPGVPPGCGTTPSPATGLGYPDCAGYMYNLQNGNCDYDLNNDDCGWDGGDCCRCTCRQYNASPYSTSDYSWWYSSSSSCSEGNFDCLDPGAPSDCATDSPTPSPAADSAYPLCEGIITYISDGDCDYGNNNEDCGWDGGDCCSCTCVDSSYTCGSGGYSCLDPDAECVSSTSQTSGDYSGYGYEDAYSGRGASSSASSFCPSVASVGDGICHDANNIEACEYDEGDCCWCTCVGDSCGIFGYSCENPDASCFGTSSSGGERSVSKTPSPTLPTGQQGDNDLASSTGGTSSSFSTGEVIGAFALSIFAFFCLGAAIIGALLLLRRKWSGENQLPQAGGGSRPQPVAASAPNNPGVAPSADAGESKMAKPDG